MEVFTEIGSLVLRVYILRALWTALYAQNAAPLNLPLHSMITYATVAMLMSLILEVDGTRLIREKIREGTIATDLMKPISVPLYFFSDGFGQTMLHALLVVPSLLCALLLVHIDVPRPATFAAFLAGVRGRLRSKFLLEFPDELYRLLDAGNFRGATDRALGFRPSLGSDNSADALPGDSRSHRLRASFCRDLFDAAPDLRRRDPAVAVGVKHRDAARMAGALRGLVVGRLARRLRPHHHPGRLGSEDLVEVAPTPVFARLKRPNHRMVSRMKMLRGVRVRRRVAAADVTARQAEPQMHPRVAGLEALLATLRRPRGRMPSRLQMSAVALTHGSTSGVSHSTTSPRPPTASRATS